MALRRTTVRARTGNFHRGRLKKVRLIVIHTGETGEGPTAAEGMGNWFANPAARGSAHMGADTDSICRYIDDGDTAFGAPNANADGWHLELAGRAGQTTAQWADAASVAILANGALAAAEASKRLGIPARWLTDAQLRDGKTAGFTTHAQCSRVLGGDHWDPGPNFPAVSFMALVKSHLNPKEAPVADTTQLAYISAQLKSLAALQVALDKKNQTRANALAAAMGKSIEQDADTQAKVDELLAKINTEPQES